MNSIHAVLKSAKNFQNQTLWEALYIDGSKVLENFFLDENALCDAFDIKSQILLLPFHERDLDNMTKTFPDFENFSHLMQITPLKGGQKVFIDEYVDTDFVIDGGWVNVKDVYSVPNTNLVWEKEIAIDDNQIWFSCVQLPGVFYWNRLHKIQFELELKFKNQAMLRDRRDKKVD